MSGGSPSDLERAHALLKHRRAADAEALCRSVLARTPSDPEALQLLGLIRKQCGDIEAAEVLLRRCIELAPRRAEFHANLGNLLHARRRLQEAAQTYRAALALDPRHALARLGLARTLNDLQQYAAAQTECRALTRADPYDAQAWATMAVSLRALRLFSEAEAAYRQAITLNPRYGAARHNLGALLAQLERTEEALEQFDRALALGVDAPENSINRGHCLLKLCRLEEAEEAYLHAVKLAPEAADAQVGLARLRYMRGDAGFSQELVLAAARRPQDASLQRALAEFLSRTGDLAGAESVLRDAIVRCESRLELRATLAGVLLDAGRLEQAHREALAVATANPTNAAVIESLVRVQLVKGDANEALPLIRTQRARQPGEQRWIAYEATAARLRRDPLYRELYDYDRFVRCYNVEVPSQWASVQEFNLALDEVLSARHCFARHPVDQSVRHGSQTARSLLAERDPLIREILRAFNKPMLEYAKEIGHEASHPLTARNNGQPIIDKCWSVRLHRQGFHANHIHPQGWISSAYYVSTPAEVEDTSLMSGWLKFGEPPLAIPGAAPEHFVQPRAGRLVLFPSYIWHGTTPLHGVAPRTSIAFDAVPDPHVQC